MFIKSLNVMLDWKLAIVHCDIYETNCKVLVGELNKPERITLLTVG